MTLKSIRISLLTVAPVLVAILGCTGHTAMSSANPSHKAADYVVFGLSVFCAPTDSLCLEEQFDRSLGQTRKRHIRENGRPHTLTLLTNGEALAEWRLRGSGGRVTMTYDTHGIAREWRYEESRRAFYGPVARPASPSGSASQAPLERGH
jgi:hypothetical protein